MSGARGAGGPGRPKVLVVSHEASRTGAPRVAVELVRTFAAAGWETAVVLRSGGPLAEELAEVAGGVSMEPLSALRAVLVRARWSKRNLVPRLERWAARRTLRRERPDLVWCNTVVSAPYAVAASDLGVPSVLHSHEGERAARRVARRARLAPALLTGSPPVLLGCAPGPAQVLADVLGVPAERVEVIHSPVDVEGLRRRAGEPRARADRPVVLAVGLGNEGKGVDVFARAAELSAERGLDVEWRWVGEVVTEVSRRHVDFAGPRVDAAREMAAATVVVLPSRADSFPLVVLEAMALERPVVASALPGPAEQLGDSGVLVPPEDPAAIVDAVERLLGDPVRAAELATEAARRCESLWDVGRFRARVLEVAAAAAGTAHGPGRRGGRSDAVRVVHVLPRLSRFGGVQIVVRRLVEILDPAEVELEAITVRGRMDIDQLDRLPIPVHALGHKTRGYSPWERLRVVADVARAVAALRPDVVQLHSGMAWLGLGARIRSPRAAFLLEVHDAPGSGRHGRLTDWLEGRWVRRLGAHAVCHSTSVRSALVERWAQPAGEVTVIPLAVDTDVFRPGSLDDRREWRQRHCIDPGVVALIAVGRLAPSKRFDLAIEVLAQLRRDGADAVLVLIGQGGEEAALRAKADELGCSEHVVFAGLVLDDELVAALQACDVLCSTSEYEGFGLTIIEAMACGLPVVATAVGGVTDLVDDGRTGFLVGADDPSAFVRHAAALVGSPERRASMGAAARARAEELYGFEQFGDAFTDLYRRLARSRGGRR